ncbi:hypothetical protein SAMN05421644_10461 [Allochromatium warmingii]|uniref:Uncharacterized protein n=1 Tax=Allochromatium warmingii TaxID=61595 RepID=A0A1H3BZ98_ALLWA|nr:hypothetical protein [Allochromatium warmingii]SDX47131.1 hypothetical protein SAMN05421644_10461 [Allochromatium warmingii]
MELFLQITAAILFGMMLFLLWPVYKHWQEHGPKAQSGDWAAALLPLGAVVVFVVLLVMAVQ